MEENQCVAVAEHASSGQLTTENPNSIEGTNDCGGGESGSLASPNVPYDPISGSNPDTASLDSGAQGASVSTYPAGYASLNGTASETANCQSAGPTANGGMANEMGGSVVEHSYEDVVYSAEEARLWNIVTINCLDFNGWVALIEETEKIAENNILKIRKVYDAFLAEFPLCFGYWKKYADHEGRLGNIDKVVEVYERAVLAVTYSVDIWYHYCQFAISTYEDPDIIRRLFERGLAYVGTDYRSDTLWDEYIKYEESHQAWSHLAMIYTRILEHPVQQLDRYFNCLKELATTRNISEIRTAEEVAMLTSTAGNADNGAHVLEGEVHPDGEDKSSKPLSAGLTDAEQLEKYIAVREEMYKKAKEYESKIIGFELAIRRPYFHIKPLDNPELENWHNYLDFIEREDDLNKVIKLYERCVIACASYSEFWIRYVLCMEARGSLELANNALARATQVFVKKQPEIHLFSAKFKELNGDVLGARAEYQHLYSELSPGLLEAIVKHANMEHRLGDEGSACSVYEKAIAGEQEKEHSQILPILLVQYSRFLYLVVRNLEKAREILAGLNGQMQVSKPVLEAVIHLESISPSQKPIEFLDSLVEKFVTPDPVNPNVVANASDREELSSIFLEFLDLFGDAKSIKKAANRHTALFSRQRSILVSKKRSADDSIISDKDKMARTGDAGQSTTGADPNGSNTYEQKTPVWPATSLVEGQQWSAAYAPQAGYSAYSGYDYGHQMPQTAPQVAAYSAYPPPYSAQAYSQQTYTQPATAAMAAPVAALPQQPAPAPQPYYGGTYY